MEGFNEKEPVNFPSAEKFSSLDYKAKKINLTIV